MCVASATYPMAEHECYAIKVMGMTSILWSISLSKYLFIMWFISSSKDKNSVPFGSKGKVDTCGHS